jgi:uncharacterized membrane protein
MYMEILRSSAGLHVFPVVSLVLFVAVFSAVLIRVVRMERARVAELASLPLSDHE